MCIVIYVDFEKSLKKIFQFLDPRAVRQAHAGKKIFSPISDTKTVKFQFQCQLASPTKQQLRKSDVMSIRKNKNNNKNCFLNQSYNDPSLFTFSFGWLWPIKTHISWTIWKHSQLLSEVQQNLKISELNQRKQEKESEFLGFSLKVLQNCDLQRTFDTSWKRTSIFDKISSPLNT